MLGYNRDRYGLIKPNKCSNIESEKARAAPGQENRVQLAEKRDRHDRTGKRNSDNHENIECRAEDYGVSLFERDFRNTRNACC